MRSGLLSNRFPYFLKWRAIDFISKTNASYIVDCLGVPNVTSLYCLSKRANISNLCPLRQAVTYRQGLGKPSPCGAVQDIVGDTLVKIE